MSVAWKNEQRLYSVTVKSQARAYSLGGGVEEGGFGLLLSRSLSLSRVSSYF